MSPDFTRPEYSPQALLEFPGADDTGGAACALLTPAIKAKLRELDSGEVLEVHVRGPTAMDDILSWSRLSGNEVLGMFSDEPHGLWFYLRKK